MPPADNTDAYEQLRELVAAVLEMDVEEVSADSSFCDELKVDSLEKVEITTRIEAAFGISLTSEEASGMDSVRDAAVLVGDRRAEAGGTDLVARFAGAHVDAGHGGRVAYIDPEAGEVSYAQLLTAARGYAGALRARGVRPGARVLVVSDDSVATVVALLGMWWHGCVPVPLSPMLDDTELRFVADDCAAEVAHLDAGPVRQRELEETFGFLKPLTGHQVREALGSGQEGPAHRPDEAPPVFVWGAGREALIQYTSGSTGRPKGVLHSAAGITAVLEGFGRVAGLDREDVVLSTARMSFGYGLGNSVLCPLAAGARTVLIRGAVDAHAVRAALRQHRPTVLFSVPRMYLGLLEAAGEGEVPGAGTLRLCVSAGEHCPAELGERVRRAFGGEFRNGLGATELMHIVLVTPPSAPGGGTAGLAVPGATVSVRDDQGVPVPEGADGRLHVAGPTAALGYLNRPRENAVTFADGGVYTGDLVRSAAGGGVEYLGRSDDMLNLGGFKVAPDQIESVVRAVEGVADCSVVGGADESGLEQAVAFIVPAAGTDTERLRKAVRSAMRAGLEPYKRVSRMEFVDKLPATGTGKLARYRLRQLVSGT